MGCECCTERGGHAIKRSGCAACSRRARVFAEVAFDPWHWQCGLCERCRRLCGLRDVIDEAPTVFKDEVWRPLGSGSRGAVPVQQGPAFRPLAPMGGTCVPMEAGQAQLGRSLHSVGAPSAFG
mmetsp:Transcript_83808/g.232258  ORF Transcript_83808/g.232258 Transcript_83808/m.232258 type:complete len:123 (+) Transcript_83808:123-491(+)